jgi:hypothetical protein
VELDCVLYIVYDSFLRLGLSASRLGTVDEFDIDDLECQVYIIINIDNIIPLKSFSSRRLCRTVA